MRADLPANESDRLAALSHYSLLYATDRSSFDCLSRSAAELFSTPFAMVTLLDANRSVIQGSYGIDLQEVSRDDCFCGHVVLCDGLLIIHDTATDSRFSDLSLVVGYPFWRFYAAAPLVTTEGFRIGTLCVADQKPRLDIPSFGVSALKDLAHEALITLELLRTKAELAAVQVELREQSLQLAESRELWRKTDQRAMLALEAGRMGYWERDSETDLVTISAGLAAIVGMEPRDHLISMDDWLRSVHKEDYPVVIETIQRASKTQENYLLHYRTRHPDGSEHWITSSGTYRTDAAGKFSGAQGVSWDSTASETAARQLKLSEELFRGLSESAPVGVFRADLEGRMTYANPRTVAICQRPAEQLLGRGWFKDVHPEDKVRLMKAVAVATNSLASADNEYRIVLDDGSIRWIQARTSILFDENSKPIGKIGTMDDVTQRLQAIRDLKSAKEAAEMANRTKDMFLANVSHELRTPLNGVLGMTDMLLDTMLNSEQAEMVKIIQDSGRSLLVLVNDLLDVGRMEAGKMQIEHIAFVLPDIIQQAVSVVEQNAEKKGLDINIHYSKYLPTRYLGDPQRIEQILLNYVSNAVKFSSNGDIAISVVEEPTREMPNGHTTCVMISVTDNGPGITPEDQSKLFRPFSQVDASSTRRNSGVGLGLAISKQLAELMGGSVGLLSTPGQGSTFWLRLPLSVPADSVRTEEGELP